MNLPEKLTDLRKKRKLSQSELADYLHISRQAVSRWETGDTVPTTDNLKLLSELYGVSLDDLLHDGPLEEEREEEIIAEPKEEMKKEPERKPNWKIIAICALLILGVVFAALAYTAVADQPKGNKLSIGGMEGERMEAGAAGKFDVEDW